MLYETPRLHNNISCIVFILTAKQVQSIHNYRRCFVCSCNTWKIFNMEEGNGMKTNKLGDWIIKTGIIFIFIFIVLLLIINYQYNRMDRFVDEIDLSKVEGIVEKFNCEIKYKDFYYNGF